jgi:hypothetical protein
MLSESDEELEEVRMEACPKSVCDESTERSERAGVIEAASCRMLPLLNFACSGVRGSSGSTSSPGRRDDVPLRCPSSGGVLAAAADAPSAAPAAACGLEAPGMRQQ